LHFFTPLHLVNFGQIFAYPQGQGFAYPWLRTTGLKKVKYFKIRSKFVVNFTYLLIEMTDENQIRNFN